MADVLILGLEMPAERGSFNLTIKYNGTVLDTETGMQVAEAYELPPHGRFGDLDRLAKEVKDMAKEFPPDSIGAERYRLFAEFIKTAPSIIPASNV